MSTHSPIFLRDLSLSLPHKLCFEGFSAQILPGARIALMGNNGSGKSTLLKLLAGEPTLIEGEVALPPDGRIAYVPQVIDPLEPASGGERFQTALTQALALDPNILILDEPTNHLDARHRRSLIKLLHHFTGTLLVATHDEDFLQNIFHTFWHMDQGRVHEFTGVYNDYKVDLAHKREAIEQELAQLGRARQETHQALMNEQARAKKSNARGEQSIRERKWPTITSHAKARQAVETAGKKKRALRDQREDLLDQLSHLRVPEVIVPTFSMVAGHGGSKSILMITEGSVGYVGQPPLLTEIHLSLCMGERMALVGSNGSGKTTLVKGILQDPSVVREGFWHAPSLDHVGYLDQHYGTLDPQKTVLETLEQVVPDWSREQIRCHLNDYLFRKNEEVMATVSTLSGGEKARLCLAQIGAKTPQLLILDEMTNNLDLSARAHVIQVLNVYPGALLLISHDEAFLQDVGVRERFYLQENRDIKAHFKADPGC